MTNRLLSLNTHSSVTGTKKCEDAESKGLSVIDEAWVRAQIALGSKEVYEAVDAPPAKRAKIDCRASSVAPAASASSEPANVWVQLEGKRATRISLPPTCIIDDLKNAVKVKCSPILDAVSVIDLCVYDGDQLCAEDEALNRYLATNSATYPLIMRVLKEDSTSAKPKVAAPATKAPAVVTAPVAAASSSPVVAYLEFKDGSSDKFYEMSLVVSNVELRYGRRNTAGVTQVKSFLSNEEALNFFEKTLAEKRKKGYQLIK